MSRVKKGQTKKMGKNDLVTLSLLTVCVAVLVLALGLHKAHAVSSRSDPGLDSAVKVLSGSDNGSDDGARAVAIQSDGKIVAAGFSSNHNSDFALVRYNTDGSLDDTFSGGGRVTTNFGGDDDEAFGVAIQADGKIVVIGFSDANRDFDFALARYNPDGSLDTSFGGDGKVLTDFGGSDDEAFGVAIQADGKIVVAGFSDVNGDFDFAIVRYNPDGSLDNTFGSGGKITTDFGGGSDDGAFALSIQTDGRIVASGFSIPGVGKTADFAIARYNPDGSLDTTFGNGGGVLTDFNNHSDDVSFAIAIQTDGKIVAAGFSDTGSGSATDFAIARYNTDGSPDTTFDNDGKVITDFGGDDDEANGVAIQSDGKIVAAGFSDANGDFDFALARYNPDGSLDTSFGGDGEVLTDFDRSDDEAFGVAIQADGRIVAAGFSDVNRDFDFAIVRYNSDGSRDNTFGSNGIVTTNFETNFEDHDNGGCAIGGPVQFETGISNVLIPLAPAIAIGLRALIRRRERQGREKK